MRTTLTLDDDVSAMLERLQNEQGLSFKEAVNRALRQGLYGLEQPLRQETFEQKSFDMGECYVNLDDIGGVLAVAEGEDFR